MASWELYSVCSAGLRDQDEGSILVAGIRKTGYNPTNKAGSREARTQ